MATLARERIGIVLQARLDSSRLPGKSMLLLGGRPLILRVMEALREIPADARALACPADAQAAFAPLAEEAGFALIKGPKDDVLARYCIAARELSLDRVIRATGDNPFVFIDAAIAINAQALELRADYAGYSGLPHGAGVESVLAGALFEAEQNAKAVSEREHVCPYLYGNPEIFLLHRPLAPIAWRKSGARLTVDTSEDYERAVKIYAALDDMERAGDFAPGERYAGASILRAYEKAFSSKEARR
ncbi:MAG: spore coat protein [Treponema sp.]|nr:spore coat protein [Treponema sp.]